MAAPYGGPRDVLLEPDTDTAWRWLCWWFGRCTDGLIELGWLVATTGNLTGFRRFPLEDESILEFIQSINSVPGQNLYFRASTISPDSPTGHTTDSFVKQSPGAWIDLDTPEHVSHARDVAADPVTKVFPCGWVCTGRVPSPRYQLYLRTSEPIVSAPLIRQINLQFLAAFGGDPAVVNPSRLMRLPGSIAWPFKAGRQPEITSFGEYSGRPTVYPLSTIAGLLPPVENQFTNGHDHAENVASVGGITRESQLIAEILSGRGRWHNAMIELVARWVHQRLSTATIMLLARAFTMPGYTQQQTSNEVRKAITGAREKWHIPEPTETNPGTASLRILSLEELDELADPTWLVHSLIPEKSLIVPYGPPKSGKSFLLLSIGLHIAAGKPWFGRAVQFGAVIYIAGEGVGGLKSRVRAMRETYDIGTDIPFWIVPRAVNFRNAAEVASLVDLVKVTVAASRFDNVPVLLVVVDTLARAMPGADENSAQDVGLVIAAADALKDQLRCAVALVHHEGKDTERGARGTSALRGAWDAAFQIVRKGAQLLFKVVDQKDSEAGQELLFDMQEVLVGIGRSTLVPVLAEVQPDTSRRARPAWPSGQSGFALKVLQDVLEGPDGAMLPPFPHLPGNTRGCHIDRWRQELYAKIPSDNPATKRQSFKRAFDALQQNGWIGTYEPYIWITRP